VELNNITGYQPLQGDRPGVIDFLAGKAWNPITSTVTAGPGGISIHEFFVSSVDGEVDLGFHFSTDYVDGVNGTRLVPESAKFSFAVNHTFVDPNAAGLAFRVFIISLGGTRVKSATDTTTGLDFTNQTAVGVDYNGPSPNFFSADNFVTDFTGRKLDVSSQTLALDIDRVEANSNFTLATDVNLHVTTIWFSVPKRAGDTSAAFNWDPYVGIVDDNAIAASGVTVIASFFLALLLVVLF